MPYFSTFHSSLSYHCSALHILCAAARLWIPLLPWVLLYSGSQEKRSRKLLFVKPKKRVVLMWIWMEFCPSSLLLPVEVVLLSLRLSWFLLILCPDSLCSCCMDLAGRGHVRMRVIFLAHPVHEGQPMKTEPDYESLGACWVSAEVCLGLIWIEACPSRERRRRRSAY